MAKISFTPGILCKILVFQSLCFLSVLLPAVRLFTPIRPRRETLLYSIIQPDLPRFPTESSLKMVLRARRSRLCAMTFFASVLCLAEPCQKMPPGQFYPPHYTTGSA